MINLGASLSTSLADGKKKLHRGGEYLPAVEHATLCSSLLKKERKSRDAA